MVTDALTAAPLAGVTVTAGALTTTTAADGSYSLAGLAPNSYTVTFAQPAYLTAQRIVTFTSREAMTLNVALTGVGGISGTVLDASTGQPIAGATLAIGAASATSNASGVFTFTQYPAGTDQLTASAAGYLAATQAVRVTAGAITNVTLALVQAGGSVSGHIYALATGSTLANVSMTLTLQSAGGATLQTLSAQSDANGGYQFTGVAAGTCTITATLTNYAANTVTLTLANNDTATLNLSLADALTISGSVTDAVTGNPIAGATLSAGGQTATTAADGSYTLSGLAPATYAVSAAAAGYRADTEVASIITGSATQSFALLPVLHISGQVTDVVTGAPVANAVVTLGQKSATADAQGNYQLDDIPAGSYPITAAAATYQPLTNSVTLTTQNVVVNFALTGYTAIAGTVCDSMTNAPLSGVTITPTPGNYTAVTNSAGYYALAQLPVQSYTLAATLTNYILAATPQPIQPVIGQTTTVNLLMTQVATLTLTAVDAMTQSPLAGVSVQLSPGSAAGTTNGSGVLTFTQLPTQTYQLAAALAGYLPTTGLSVTVTPGADSLQVPLTPSGVLTGTVLADDAGNTPIAGATITLTPGMQTATTDANGNYTFAALAVGTYSVTVTANGYGSAVQSVTISHQSDRPRRLHPHRLRHARRQRDGRRLLRPHRRGDHHARARQPVRRHRCRGLLQLPRPGYRAIHPHRRRAGIPIGAADRHHRQRADHHRQPGAAALRRRDRARLLPRSRREHRAGCRPQADLTRVEPADRDG